MIRTPFLLAIVIVVCVHALDTGTEDRIRSGYGNTVADSLASIITGAGNSGLPVMPLENKVKEGLAKKRSGPELLVAVCARRDLLARIREENRGRLPDDYVKQLFALEKQHPAAAGSGPVSRKALKIPCPAEPKATDVAKAFGVSVDSVERLKTTYSTGYGGLSKAFALSAKSGLDVAVILRMKTEDNLGWGEIARKLDLGPGRDYKAETPVDPAKNDEALEKQQKRMEDRAEERALKMEKRMNRGKGPNGL